MVSKLEIFYVFDKINYFRLKRWIKNEIQNPKEQSLYLDCFRIAENILFHLMKADVIPERGYNAKLEEFSEFLVNTRPKYNLNFRNEKEFAALCLYKMIDRHPSDTYIRPSCNPIYFNRFYNAYTEALLAICVSMMSRDLICILEDSHNETRIL